MENELAQDKGRNLRKGIVAAGVAAGLTLAGLGVSWAQTDGGSTTTTPPDQQQAPPPDGGVRPDKGPGGRHGGKGFGMGIHGEFTTKAPGGGYQTIATQHGEVTDVSATSLKVKSEDGFERAYVVNDDTMVGAGNNGIADVKVGDKVDVTAVVDGNTATAKNLHTHPDRPAE